MISLRTSPFSPVAAGLALALALPMLPSHATNPPPPFVCDTLGELSPVVGFLSPAVGLLSPIVGRLSPALGHLSPALGTLSPAVGELSPVTECVT